MLDAMHTFLHFLADHMNIPVRHVRADQNDPSSGVLQVGAINVTFLDFHLETGENTIRAVIDVLFETEVEQYSAITALSNLLMAAYYTPMLSYASPSLPVAVGGNLSWDRDDVTFMRVSVDNYCHHTCVLTLRYA